MLIRYRTTGTLTGTIEPENLEVAQRYLAEDDMTGYLDGSLEKAVGHVRWNLNGDGHTYYIEALAHRELTTDELRMLSEWCSGQNSDGLGEGFEQQPFAEQEQESEEDCGACDGSGADENSQECQVCGGAGFFERESYGMISFDWQTNKLPFERV